MEASPILAKLLAEGESFLDVKVFSFILVR